MARGSCWVRLLEPDKISATVARPELGDAVLGLLRAHDADGEFVRSVHPSSPSDCAYEPTGFSQTRTP